MIWGKERAEQAKAKAEKAESGEVETKDALVKVRG